MTDLRATYRLQLTPGFGFAAACRLVPYLAELGVSHLYLSPSFEAREGSTHGYDIVDPGRLSAALGGEEGFRTLAAAAAAAGLGIVLDVVPNHMAADDANRFWADPALRRRFFDVDEETGLHRRFFDIDHLAGVRVEDPEVFRATQGLALALVEEGLVDGLRVDHPDGLADPRGYLERLRAGGVRDVWVEKILDPGEPLPAEWPVCGTTGYEFLNDAIALFVDAAAEGPLTALHAELTGERRHFAEIAHAAKLEQARATFSREVAWLERLWPDAPGDVAAALASLPVYRTYVRQTEPASAQDREVLAEAGLEWLLGAPGAFATRFQQTTPPVMAKGVEDTAFYRYGRLLALNDVGGDPSRFGIAPRRLHEANASRARDWPRAMLTLQTHDAKRSADVRARIAAITWLLDDFAALARRVVPAAPDPGEGWFFLQTALGAPVADDRLRAYVEKALRERKWSSSWIDPDERHERAMADWAVSLLDDAGVRDLAARLAEAARPIVLGQKLLQLTAPGVPDVYQGDEDDFIALVDPDNRRPVDWEALRRGEPSPKLALTRSALDLRRRRPAAFVGAPYAAVDAPGGAVAFTRGEDAQVFVGVAVRPGVAAPAPPGGGWRAVFAAEGLLLAERG